MAITDPDSGRYVDINSAFETTTGYSRSEVLGRSSLELNLFVEPDQRQRILRHLDKQNSVHGVEVAVRVRDGRVLHGLFSASRLVLQERELLLTQMLDITERKRAEADLRTQAQALERSNAELEQFSYSISHDMRQPLRMISSYLQLIERELGATLSADQRGYFHFAIDGAQRLDTMLVGLLEYSRVGRRGEPPGWLASRAALDDALLFLQPAIAEAGAAMRIAGDWPRLFARRDELLRLLQNLIGNALKFRLAGQPPDIRIDGACSGSGPEAMWRCCIADNGIGIPPDQAGRLFQVFQRLQSRTRYEGTGIGLALCRKIVEHHDGHIWVESAGENLGSRFCFEIPLAEGAPSALPAGPAEAGT
jgi:PAS domain S-box-containing protein